MRRPARFACLALALLLDPAALLGAGVAVGERLDDDVLATLLADPAGEVSTLGDHWGERGAMVVFAANACPYVLDWLDRLPRMADFAAESGIGFVVVNANARRRTTDDAPAAMAELAAEHAFDFPYLVDREATLADALGATRTPEVFLFDADRTLVYQGAIDDHSGPFAEVSAHWALDALRQMAAGDAVTAPATAPIGCSVLRPRPPRRSGG